MIIQRISIAKEIFTREEIIELTKYEFVQLWEISKQHIEWFLYSLVILIWIGVATCCVALFRTYRLENRIIERAPIEKPLSEEDKKINFIRSKEKPICEVINSNKSPKSNIETTSIYWKVVVEANKWKIDPCIILALIEKESNFYEEAVGKDYYKKDKQGYRIESLGWSQVTKSTWDTFNANYVWPKYKETWPVEDKKDPDKSLTFICWYLTWLQNYNKNITNVETLYAAYNGGPNCVKEGGVISKKDAEVNAKKFKEIYDRYFVVMY